MPQTVFAKSTASQQRSEILLGKAALYCLNSHQNVCLFLAKIHSPIRQPVILMDFQSLREMREGATSSTKPGDFVRFVISVCNNTYIQITSRKCSAIVCGMMSWRAPTKVSNLLEEYYSARRPLYCEIVECTSHQTASSAALKQPGSH